MYQSWSERQLVERGGGENHYGGFSSFPLLKPRPQVICAHPDCGDGGRKKSKFNKHI